MPVKSLIVLAVIFMVFLLVIVAELRAERLNYFYSCYIHMRYRNMADNFLCKGNGTDGCSKCPYNKQWKKENKHGKKNT